MYQRVPLSASTRDVLLPLLGRLTHGSHLFSRVPELLKLVTSYDDICAWMNDRQELVGVATCVTFKGRDLAEVWLLPWTAPSALLEAMWAWLEERLPDADLWVEAPLPQGEMPVRSWLHERGWSYFYTVQAMELLDLGRGLAKAELLPPGVSWQPYDETLFASYYETLTTAFAGRPGITVLPAEQQMKRCRQFGDKLVLLVRDSFVVGFVRVEVHPDGSGELVSLARHPSERGQGLGRCLVAKGLELVRARGAKRAVLEVTLENPQAVKLYEGFGFRRQMAMDTWHIKRKARPT